jgi:hypothetical protein
MPSRQERRKAERDAAKRAPATTGAAGAGGAAAARAGVNVNVNPLGDWTTQTADPNVGPTLNRHVHGGRSADLGVTMPVHSGP